MGMFHYTMHFHPEDDELYLSNRNSDNSVTEHGIIAAKNYGKAVNKLVKYYGIENVIEISVYELENPLTMEDLAEFPAIESF